MKISNKDWPFKKGKEVTLYWMQSPKMEGESKQWVITAIFKQDAEPIPVKLPWGLLPYLRIGRVYVDGVRGQAASNLLQRDIKFQQTVRPINKRAGDVIPRTSYPLNVSSNLAQMCVYIKNGSETLIIPCIEIIRAYLCPNKTMCNAVLDPIGLQQIASVRALSNQKMELQFTNSTPVNLLKSSEFINKIAHILTDGNLKNTWNSVWNSLNHPHKEVIDCITPDLLNAQWTVLGLYTGSGFLVTEILKIEQKTTFPFQMIDVLHPKLVNQDVGGSQHGGRIINRNFPLNVEASLTQKSPKNFRNPRMIVDQIVIFQTGNNIKINRIFSDLNNSSNTLKKKVTRRVRMDDRATEEISFYDVAGTGNVQAAEFNNLNGEIDGKLSPCFHEFARAIQYMGQSRGYQVDYVEESIPYFLEENRDYLLVRIKARYRCVWILEMDQLQSNSTLIFIAKNDEKTTGEAMAKHLIEKFLSPRGWDKEGIQKIIGMRVRWAKHTTSFMISWGERLGNKVNDLDIVRI
nr:hypothetical protein [Ferroacidibacillus organovorans]